MRKEMWLPVVGYEGRYEVSDRGRVRIINSKTMRAAIHHTGYSVVSLRNEGGRAQHGVHRLVAMAFLNNPLNKPIVNHRNLLKSDNRVENLEWATHRENSLHASSLGIGRGERNGRSVLSENQVLEIRERIGAGELRSSIAREYGIDWSTADAIFRRRKWKHI